MVAVLPSPNQSNLQTVVNAFLAKVCDPAIEVVEGDQNLVPEPAVGDYIVMTTIWRDRVSTNIDLDADCAFVGTIAGTALTVTSVPLGRIVPPVEMFGVDVIDGTHIMAQVSGTTGGAGVYTVDTSQTIAVAEKMASGVQSILQPTEIRMQLSIHSDDAKTSSDIAQTLSTLFRDSYSVEFFQAFRDPDTGEAFDIVPLFAGEPKKITFENAEQNTETVWIVEVDFQVNAIVKPSQEFADQLHVSIREIDATYPAT